MATEAALGDMIHTVEKKIAATTGALKQMKRANKYDKSISAKQKMIERMQTGTQGPAEPGFRRSGSR